jgi:hypothetical protein
LRSTKRPLAPSTPTLRSASTTLVRSCRIRPIWPAPGRLSSGRCTCSRSSSRAIIRTSPTHAIICRPSPRKSSRAPRIEQRIAGGGSPQPMDIASSWWLTLHRRPGHKAKSRRLGIDSGDARAPGTLGRARGWRKIAPTNTSGWYSYRWESLQRLGARAVDVLTHVRPSQTPAHRMMQTTTPGARSGGGSPPTCFSQLRLRMRRGRSCVPGDLDPGVVALDVRGWRSRSRVRRPCLDPEVLRRDRERALDHPD